MTRMLKRMSAIFALALVFGLTLPALAADTKGVIKTVTVAKQEVVVTIQGRDYPFHVAPNAPIQVNNKPGKLSDLKPNDAVMISFSQGQNQLIATQIIRP